MDQHLHCTESIDFVRLRWRVQKGPLSPNIHVLENAEDANSPQTPFQDPETGQLHSVSKLPFTTPPTSEWVVRVDPMDGYKNWHEADDDEVDDPVNPNPEKALPDGWKGPYLKLRSDNGFITIGDFFSAVHPWLVHLRPRYLREYNLVNECHLGPDVDLWVDVQFSFEMMLLNAETDNLEECYSGFAEYAIVQNKTTQIQG